MKRFLFAVLFLVPGLSLAQNLPEPIDLYVNDYAKIIDDDTETRLRSALKSLRDETGVETTVLTIYTRWAYDAGNSLEDFATTLFNNWGIGNADKNDGILILVISEDRDMRIELGAGYPVAYDNVAGRIIRTTFLPAFKENRYSMGIESGTLDVIDQIARPFAAGQEPEEPAGTSGKGPLNIAVIALLALPIALIPFFRKLRDRFRRCPSCGQRGIHRTRETLQKATRTAKGKGEETISCTNCGYVSTTPFIIPVISSSSSSSGGSFGGGSSSGGGASGRW